MTIYQKTINATLEIKDPQIWGIEDTYGFIFYGKQGEFSSNNVEAQEISLLSLHLLQSSLVYVNTLMAQEVLTEPYWSGRMTEADWQGLTPLFFNHVNPYRSFNLDMDKRIRFAYA